MGESHSRICGIEGVLVLAVMVGQIWLSPSRFLMAAVGVDWQMFPYVVLAVGAATLLLIAAFELLMVVMRSAADAGHRTA